MTVEKTNAAAVQDAAAVSQEEKIFVATQWQLMWWRFRKHKMAIVGVIILVLLYVIATFSEFLSPYDPNEFRKLLALVPAQGVHILSKGKLVWPWATRPDASASAT